MHSTVAYRGDAPEALTQVFTELIRDGELPGALLSLRLEHDERDIALGSMTWPHDTPMRSDAIFRIQSMTKPVVAVVILRLVEEGLIALDDPVDRWLPELADRVVLTSPLGSLDDVVPASRPISVRDLLTFQAGYGVLDHLPATAPIRLEMERRLLTPRTHHPDDSIDDWLRRFIDLPLLHQPGDGWLYSVGSELQGALIARVLDQSLAIALRERIFDPLGMEDTGFSVPAASLDRFTTMVIKDAATGALTVDDPATGGPWTSEPKIGAGQGGLVSTAEDWSRFTRMLLNGGTWAGVSILRPESVQIAARDHIRASVKRAYPFMTNFWDVHGYGFGMAPIQVPGVEGPRGEGYGWDGGGGTSWINVPALGLSATLFTQRRLDEWMFRLLPRFWALAIECVST